MNFNDATFEVTNIHIWMALLVFEDFFESDKC